MVEAAVTLLRGPVKNSDLVPHHDEQGEPVRLILVDRRRAWADERVRQAWLPSEKPVLLDDHQTAVADRAASIGRRVHLPSGVVEALWVAGRHHDDGKADRRFQAGLGAGLGPANDLLAKSGGLSAAEFRRLADQAGLPERWRHEQRSVVVSWEAVHAALPPEYAQLAARLVGTSHGHGRHGFPHTAAELFAHDDSDADRQLAEDLFDLGIWDNLIEATHHRWGVWGCAYLEALLRAADGQVSGEGK
jgi:CRISPR-associated endonuclease/helicase Cas3